MSGSLEAGRINTVVFDWGGTLSVWPDIDWESSWECLDIDLQARQSLVRAENKIWNLCRETGLGLSFVDVFRNAGVGLLDEYLDALKLWWLPYTQARGGAIEILQWLKDEGYKVGLLSNTLWPASWHDDFLAREGLDSFIDVAQYSSSTGYSKPSVNAFNSILRGLRVHNPTEAVFVGDRPFEDIYGASEAGMATIYLVGSEIPLSQGGGFVHAADANVDDIRDIKRVLELWDISTGSEWT